MTEKIRARWANVKIGGGSGPRSEEHGSDGKVDVDDDGTDSSSGGNAVITRIRHVFGGRHEGREGRSDPNRNASDARDEIALDEIGLGG